MGDIGKAKVLANMLKDDEQFYTECSEECKENKNRREHDKKDNEIKTR